jgi:pyruvate-formate lyase-activating enzyme
MSVPELNQAINAHRHGDAPQAERLYRAVLARSPTHAVAGYNLGILLLAQARLDGLPFVLAALATPVSAQAPLDRAAASASAVQALLSHQYQAHAADLMRWLDEAGVQAQGHAELWQRCRLPDHLAPTSAGAAPAPAREGRPAPTLLRYHPIESSRYVYAIDIVGGCNLRCPTCPVGQGAALPKGLMELALFEQVLAKIVRERAPHRPDIWLFNWGEPLLHPRVGEFIRAVRDAGLTSMLSTNLNHGERIDAVMQANPERLKVSLSSLRQQVYGQTHARGDIERVKRNLERLARARERHAATTQIWIGHHLYRNTLVEQTEVRALAGSLGFGYAPSAAIVAPIETAMQAAAGVGAPAPLQEQLLVQPRDIQGQSRARRSGRFDCELRFNMTALDHRGHVGLCCGTTQPLGAVPVPFLEHDHEELERMKYTHSFCRRCMGQQMHLTTADQ